MGCYPARPPPIAQLRHHLVPGNVVTVEPGVYIPGFGGVRLEDYGVVTQEGYEPFTSSTHDLVVLPA